MFYLYHHINPINGEVFYVGIASRKDRAKYFYNRNKFWKAYVQKHGTPIVKIVAEFSTLEEAAQAEIEDIKKFGRRSLKEKSATLVNMADGGGLNIGWKQSDEAKERIRKSQINRPTTERQRNFLIHNNPSKREDVKRKISLSKLGKKRSPETLEKMSINASSRRPDVAEKISQALKGRTGELHSRSVKVVSKDKNGLECIYHGISEAARITGSDFRLISACCLGKRKSHNGYVWRYY